MGGKGSKSKTNVQSLKKEREKRSLSDSDIGQWTRKPQKPTQLTPALSVTQVLNDFDNLYNADESSSDEDNPHKQLQRTNRSRLKLVIQKQQALNETLRIIERRRLERAQRLANDEYLSRHTPEILRKDNRGVDMKPQKRFLSPIDKNALQSKSKSKPNRNKENRLQKGEKQEQERWKRRTSNEWRLYDSDNEVVSKTTHDVGSWQKHPREKKQQRKVVDKQPSEGSSQKKPARRHRRRSSLDEDVLRKGKWDTRNEENLPQIFSKGNVPKHKGKPNRNKGKVRRRSSDTLPLRSAVSLPSLPRSRNDTPNKFSATSWDSRKAPSTQSSGILGKQLDPYPKPSNALDEAFRDFNSGEWEQEYEALTAITRLAEHHPEVLYPQLVRVVKAVMDQIKNLRSQVCRAAVQTMGHLLLRLRKESLNQELDSIVALLLHRSADTNKFIKEDCNHALDNMLTHTSPARVAAAVLSGGLSHKNVQVRTNVARLLADLTEIIGAGKVLSGQTGLTDRVLSGGAQLLQDGSLEIRTQAKRLFTHLVAHPDFERQYQRHVSDRDRKETEKTMEGLKKDRSSKTVTKTTTSRHR